MSQSDDEISRIRDAVFRSCERFPGGRHMVLPRMAIAELLEEVAENELPDLYGEGSIIEGLEQEVAGLLGKPAAAFMLSGTAAQSIALRIWADRKKASRVAFHPQSHLELHEERGYANLHGLDALLVGDPDRLITLDDLEAMQESISALLLELPQREIGGELPSWEALNAQTSWARDRGTALHMDGARLWECQPFYQRDYSEIAGLFDSVYVSFYKGLGGIAGAALAGPEDFIAEARTWLHRHGGRLVQMYPYVLSARRGLRTRLHRFPDYYRQALALAKVLERIPGISVRPNPPHTNMMQVTVEAEKDRIMEASLEIARRERVCLVRGTKSSAISGVCSFEMAVTEGTDILPAKEVDRLYRLLLRTAKRD